MIVQTAGYVIVLAVWSYIRINRLLDCNKRKEAAVYGCLMGIAAFIGAILIARMDVPSFIVPFQMLLEPIGKKLLTS
ncbi:hypothetical protein [Paenibacillus silvisoli]|uniref:hypothetical protein n=1 Tax=Paenibacillus silvisoli TaxID=3110539 RepID=UPI002805D441|nr:hypothetical protein [Paenibacillus silvisoli]